jgi:hypothetical protein
MEEGMKTEGVAGQIAGSRPLVRILRGLFIFSSMALLSALSFVFLPAGPREYRDRELSGLASTVADDRSPLGGVVFEIPGVHIRRLDRLAVVTFTYDLFDAQQNLRPAGRSRLMELARGLRAVRAQISVEVEGYAPEHSGSDGYAVGLLRAAHVADCLASAADLPPSAIALRSLGDTEVRGPADRPHAVVIMISPAEDSARRAVAEQVAALR